MVQNQCLSIPPSHPFATEIVDLLGLQWTIIEQQNAEAALVNAGGDRASYDRHNVALALVGEQINLIRRKYRAECGADETCTVGLTHDARGAPVVQRPGGPILTVVSSTTGI